MSPGWIYPSTVCGISTKDRVNYENYLEDNKHFRLCLALQYVRVIVWMWVQLRICTASDIWKFSQNCTGLLWVQFQRMFKCHSTAQAFIWLHIYDMTEKVTCKLKINDELACSQPITRKWFSPFYNKLGYLSLDIICASCSENSAPDLSELI